MYDCQPSRFSDRRSRCHRHAFVDGPVPVALIWWDEPDTMPEWCGDGRYRELVHRDFGAMVAPQPTRGEM